MIYPQPYRSGKSFVFKILYCLPCQQNFMSDYGKAIHDKKFHKKHIKSKCPFCSKYFYQLQNHIANMHARSLKEKECKLCGKMFENDKARRKHVRSHPKIGKCYRVCNFCSKHFKYYYDAMDHACTR